MKTKYLYIIFYRNGEGQILKYITNAPELYQAVLPQLRRDGREIVKHFKERL